MDLRELLAAQEPRVQLECLGLRDQSVVLALLGASVTQVKLGRLDLMEVREYQAQLDSQVLQDYLVALDSWEALGLLELRELADPMVSKVSKEPLVHQVQQVLQVVPGLTEQRVPLE